MLTKIDSEQTSSVITIRITHLTPAVKTSMEIFLFALFPLFMSKTVGKSKKGLYKRRF